MKSGARLAYFDGLYGADADPYGLRGRWYERRKRQVLLACLPERTYARAFEPGCGAGELTHDLAARVGTLLASDFSARAVASARARCEALSNVRVVQQRLPDDWPRDEAAFDLIVLSEIGYFLDRPAWQAVALQCLEALAPGGALVACDWLPDFAERALPASAVHAELEGLGLPRLVRHEEADFLLQVWCRDGRSVAQREGIR